MKFVRNYIDGIFDRIFSVLGAVSLAQFPQFVQQYIQRLGGHADEARRIVERFAEAAQRSGRSLEEYIYRFRTDADPEIAEQGIIMQEAVERADFLMNAVQALEGSSLITRPFLFLANLDTDIAWNTMQIFQPGVPTTIEGGVYAFAGILLGLAVYHGIKYPVKRLTGKKQEQGI